MNNVITVSPFKFDETERDYSFSVIDLESGDEISDAVYLRGVVKSLLEDAGEIDIVGCGCSVAGCSGFWSERFRKSAELVVWEIQQYKNKYTLNFDRSVYERDALAMLKDMVARNIGWNELAVPEYESYEAFKEDVFQVEAALDEHYDYIEDSNTPLMNASARGNLDEVKKLLADGVNVDEWNCYGWNALMLSIEFERREVFDYLISNGANVDIMATEWELTPLLIAAMYHRVEMFFKLIELGARVEREQYCCPTCDTTYYVTLQDMKKAAKGCKPIMDYLDSFHSEMC